MGELLRLATAGSVDDGKSTLIGRLLYDAKAILADQLEQVQEASRRRNGNGAVDLAVGLRDNTVPARAHYSTAEPLDVGAVEARPFHRRQGHSRVMRVMNARLPS